MKLLAISVCLLVALTAVVSAKKPSKSNTKLKWGNDKCDQVKLEARVSKLDQKKVNEKKTLDRCVKAWQKLGTSAKTAINKAIKAKDLSSLSKENCAKIPVCCRQTLPLDTLTEVQILYVVEKTGDTNFLVDALASLTATKCDALYKVVKDVTKPSAASPYKDLLSDEAKQAIGYCAYAEVVNAGQAAECAYILGALTNSGMTKSNIQTLAGFVVTKSCAIPRDIVEALATVAVDKFKSDDLATILPVTKYLLQYLGVPKCKKIFTTKRTKTAFASANAIKALNLKNIKWNSNKCPGKGCPPCMKQVAHMLARAFNKISPDVATFDRIGPLVACMPPGQLKKMISKFKCKDLNLCKLYRYSGNALSTPVRKIITECAKKLDIADFTTATDAQLKAIACYIVFLQPADLKKLLARTAVLCKADLITEMKDYLQYSPEGSRILRVCNKKFDKSIARQKKCGNERRRPGKARKIRAKYTTSEIKSLTDDDAVGIFEDDNLRNEMTGEHQSDVCKLTDKAVKKKTTVRDKAAESVFFCRCFRRDGFDYKTVKDLNKLKNSDLTPAQQIFLLEKLEPKPENLKASELKTVARCLPRAITPEYIEKLTQIDVYGVVKACSFEDDDGNSIVFLLRRRTVKAILDRVEGVLSVDNEADPYAAMDERLAESMGLLLAYPVDIDKLKNAIPSVKKMYLEQMKKRLEIGADGLRCTPLPDRVKIWAMSKEVILSGKAPKTSTELEDLGNLACLMSSSDLTGISDAVFKESIGVFATCAVFADPKGMAVKIKAVYGDMSTWTEETVEVLGISIITDVFEKWLSIPGPAWGLLKFPVIDNECYTKRFGKKPKFQLVVQVAVQAILSQTSKRRKRATDSGNLNYATLSTWSDDMLLQLSVANINKITNDDFKALSEKLAGVDGWSLEQRNALASKLKTVLGRGKFCDFTALELVAANNILYAITDTEINCMDFSGEKATPFTGLTKWSVVQYSKLAAEYKKDRSLTISSLDKTKLSELGSFVCGLNLEDVEKIPPAALKEAASQISDRLIGCQRSKLLALLRVAEKTEAFGPVKDWTSGIISEVGNLILAIDKEDMKSLGVRAADIPYEYLLKMRKDVLEAMTKEAREKLTEEERKALGVEDDGSSGASFVIVNGLLLVMTVFVTGTFSM